MKRRLVSVAVTLVVFTLLIAACPHTTSAPPRDAPAAASTPAAEPIQFLTMKMGGEVAAEAQRVLAAAGFDITETGLTGAVTARRTARGQDNAEFIQCANGIGSTERTSTAFESAIFVRVRIGMADFGSRVQITSEVGGRVPADDASRVVEATCSSTKVIEQRLAEALRTPPG